MTLFKQLVNWLVRRSNLYRSLEAIHQHTAREWAVEHTRLQEAREQIDHIDKERMWLRSRVCTLRAGQSEQDRAGWEVCCYIPSEVLAKLNTASAGEKVAFVRRVVDVLVAKAVAGLIRVNAMGKVNALLYAPLNMHGEPKAPEWCQVLFDNEGEYKLSERLTRLHENEKEGFGL